MINNNPGGRLWVDPDGVEGLGQAYDGHVQMYETYLAQLLTLRSRYANAWGDDDMGKQFSTKFLEGMDNLEAIIGGVKGTLNYTAEGLKESSRAYREADEAAAEVSLKMAKDFGDLEKPVYAARTTEDEVLSPTEGEQRGVLRPGKLLARKADVAPLAPVEGERRQGRLLARKADVAPVEGVLRPTERLAVEGTLPRTVEGRKLAGRVEAGELRGFSASRRPAHEADELEPLLPAQKTRLLAPTEAHFSAAQPAMPAISSYFMKPEYATAYVGGQALPPEYRLISLNPFEDGSTRVDANLYDSMTPVTSTPVTAPDGTPIDPGQGQFFVVKENPTVDPTVQGYQPLFLSYSPDGTPTPIFPGA